LVQFFFNLADGYFGILAGMVTLLDQKKTICSRALRVTTQETQQNDPKMETLPNMTIALANAHGSLIDMSEEFNIPVNERTFGKGIVRVSCQTIAQLDNIALIMEELVKFNLIVEVGMEPLAYSDKMNSLVVYFKPADLISSQKIDYVFQNYSSNSLEYHHLVIDNSEN